MTNTITFQQHILTSSKARRGFRTYQRTLPMDEITDEKLGRYGLYSPTAYSNVSDMLPQDYPELFMYYSLDDNRKVVCRSRYIGDDLHSHPPRPGNYLSHALLHTGNVAFNPADIYNTVSWKTAQEIAEEDRGLVPEEIAHLSVPLTHDHYYNRQYLEGLVIPVHHYQPGTTGGNALAIRQKMLANAIAAIINGQRLVIIDDSKMLIKWTLTLLQLFPLQYTFKHLSITSFANSNHLLDICRVLCIEKDNAERVLRHCPQAVVIDLDAPQPEPSSMYAELLLNAITTDTFSEFAKEVFPRLEASGNYSAAGFNDHALLYYGLQNISRLKPGEFEHLLTRFAGKWDVTDKIFREIKQAGLVSLCTMMWRVLLNNGACNTLHDYEHIAGYVIPSRTDDSWMEFERTVAGTIKLHTIDEINKFFSLTSINHPARSALHYEKIMALIKDASNPELIRTGLKAINEKVSPLSTEQQKEMLQLGQFLDILNMLDSHDSTATKYNRYVGYLSATGGFRAGILEAKLPGLDWDDFFPMLEKDNTTLRALYGIPHIRPLLPVNSIAQDILARTYESDPDGFRKKIYETLNAKGRDAFEKYAPNNIRQLIDRQPAMAIHDSRPATGQSLDAEQLSKMIVPPWLNDDWEKLFRQLDEDERKRLPGLLHDLLKIVKQGYRISAFSSHSYLSPLAQWRIVICQYYAFLITKGYEEDFKRLIKKVPITWSEYDHITKILLMTMHQSTLFLKRFHNPSNLNNIPPFNGSGPLWRHYD